MRNSGVVSSHADDREFQRLLNQKTVDEKEAYLRQLIASAPSNDAQRRIRRLVVEAVKQTRQPRESTIQLLCQLMNAKESKKYLLGQIKNNRETAQRFLSRPENIHYLSFSPRLLKKYFRNISDPISCQGLCSLIEAGSADAKAYARSLNHVHQLPEALVARAYNFDDENDYDLLLLHSLNVELNNNAGISNDAFKNHLSKQISARKQRLLGEALDPKSAMQRYILQELRKIQHEYTSGVRLVTSTNMKHFLRLMNALPPHVDAIPVEMVAELGGIAWKHGNATVSHRSQQKIVALLNLIQDGNVNDEALYQHLIRADQNLRRYWVGFYPKVDLIRCAIKAGNGIQANILLDMLPEEKKMLALKDAINYLLSQPKTRENTHILARVIVWHQRMIKHAPLVMDCLCEFEDPERDLSLSNCWEFYPADELERQLSDDELIAVFKKKVNKETDDRDYANQKLIKHYLPIDSGYAAQFDYLSEADEIKLPEEKQLTDVQRTRRDSRFSTYNLLKDSGRTVEKAEVLEALTTFHMMNAGIGGRYYSLPGVNGRILASSYMEKDAFLIMLDIYGEFIRSDDMVLGSRMKSMAFNVESQCRSDVVSTYHTYLPRGNLISDRLARGEVVSQAIGWNLADQSGAHTMRLSFFKVDGVVYAAMSNRGAGRAGIESGITFFKVGSPDKLDDHDFLRKLYRETTTRQYVESIYSTDAGSLGADLSLTKIGIIKKSPQKYGNCALASCNNAILVNLMAEELKRGEHTGELTMEAFNSAHEKVKPFYKRFKHFSRKRSISNLVTIGRHDIKGHMHFGEHQRILTNVISYVKRKSGTDSEECKHGNQADLVAPIVKMLQSPEGLNYISRRYLLVLIKEAVGDEGYERLIATYPAHALVKLKDANIERDIDGINEALASGDIDLNARDFEQNSVLEWAIFDNLDMVAIKVIEKMSADQLNAQHPKTNETPLICAIKYDKEDLADHLLDQEGIDLMARDGINKNALDWAIAKGFDGVAEKIINLMTPEQLNERNPETNLTPLMLAVRFNRREVVNQLLNKAGVDIGIRDNDHDTALDIAIVNGLEGIAKDIVCKTSPEQLNALHPVKHITPLILAVLCGRDKVVKRLVKQPGVDLSVRDGLDGIKNTALDLAIQRGFDEIAKAIITKMTPEQLNAIHPSLHLTPLMAAVVRQRESVVECLIDQDGIDFALCDRNSNTALECAIMARFCEMAIAIINKMPAEQLCKRNPITGFTPHLLADVLGLNGVVDHLTSIAMELDDTDESDMGAMPNDLDVVLSRPVSLAANGHTLMARRHGRTMEHEAKVESATMPTAADAVIDRTHEVGSP